MLIPTNQNVRTITNMRENALGLLDDVKKQGLTYIFHHSKPKVVMLPIDEFVKLQERLEDFEDEKDAKELSKEKRGKGIGFDAIIKKYG